MANESDHVGQDFSTGERDGFAGWPRPGVSALVIRQDRVLLGQRAKPPLRGLWSLPGGHIEPGEKHEDAACREVLEETGVTVAIEGVAGVRDVIVRDDDGRIAAHYVLTVLLARWLAGEPVAAGDCLDARWVPVHDLGSYEMTDGTQAFVEKQWPEIVRSGV